jgi:hypothetical protein
MFRAFTNAKSACHGGETAISPTRMQVLRATRFLGDWQNQVGIEDAMIPQFLIIFLPALLANARATVLSLAAC